MSFSLKYVFVVVALAAIFAAALVARTPLWGFVAIQLTLVIVLTAATGVLLGRLSRIFWTPFCVFAWTYFVLSFTLMSEYLPGEYLTERVLGSLTPVRVDATEAERLIMEWHRFTDIVDCLFGLVAGVLAGITSVLLIRQKRDA